MAEALYRKYRPQVFEDVVGQEPIERTLKNAIVQDKVSHAYLFTGPRGTGKTTTARLLAKALLCEKGPSPDPDGVCEDCQLIAEGTHPDVYELDAASRTGVENVREEIISRVSFAPTRGRYKVYIIDEVHMLSTAAFNALLKTLEEPPGHVVFVLCTTDPQKVPETIHSRCQRFDFRRIAPESMVSRLGAICIAENVEFEGEALDLIAHRAEGGLRNALTSLEQIIAFENGKVTLAGAERLLGSIDSNDMAEIIAYVGRRDIANCFQWTAAYVETGADLAQFVRDMAEHVRNLYVMSLVGDDVELDIGETSRHELIGELQWFGPDRLARLLGVLGDLTAELKTSSNPRLAFEIALTRMVRPDSDLTLESLAERVEALESGYSAVAHVLPGEPVRFADDGTGAGDAYADVPDFSVQKRASAGQVPFSGRQAGPAQGQNAGTSQVWASEGVQKEAGWQSASQSAWEASQPMAGNANTASASIPGRGPAQEQPSAQTQTQPAFDQRAVAQPAESLPSEQSPAPASREQAQSMQGQPGPVDDKLSVFANPAALQRIWQAALSALKRQKQAYGVLFMNTKVRFDEGAGMLKVVFPEESAFAFNAVQKPDVQDALSASLDHAAGCAVPFAYEKAGASVTAVAAAAGNPASATAFASEQHTAFAAPDRIQAQPDVRPETSSAGQVDRQSELERQVAAGQRFQGESTTAQQSSAAQPVYEQPVQQPAQQPSGAQPSQQQTAHQPDTAKPVQEQPVQPSPASQASPQTDPYEQPPWDEVPYDEMPYEPVPYEEFDAGYGQANAASDAVFDAASGAVPDVTTSASPATPNLTPDGAIEENPADVEAMLQAGFGGGVIFSEVE